MSTDQSPALSSPLTRVRPPIIQGGMGVGVSGWQLARAVSGMGQLGVVSGTAIDVVMARRLQSGDPDGDVRRALAHFPVQLSRSGSSRRTSSRAASRPTHSSDRCHGILSRPRSGSWS